MEVMHEKWPFRLSGAPRGSGTKRMATLMPPEKLCKALEELHEAEELVVLGDGKRQPLILFDVDRWPCRVPPRRPRTGGA